MKIAWFHSHLLHPNSGGTRYLVDYCIGLREKGHEVTIFCDVIDKSLRNTMHDSGIKAVCMDVFSTNSPVYWFFLPVLLLWKRIYYHRQIKTFDVLITTMFPMNILICSFNMPRIQICYEPYAFFYDKNFLKNFNIAQQIVFKILGMIWKTFDKIAIRRMDSFVAINKTMASTMQDLFHRSCKILPGWIEESKKVSISSEEKANIRQKYKGYPLIFHSTDMTALKGTLPFLEILKGLKEFVPNFKMLVSVYIDLPDQIKKLQDEIKRLDLQNNIEYIGCLPKEQLPLYYAAVDFVAQPSLNQPLNWPLNESLRLHTPIIAGAKSEEVLHKINGIKIDVSNKMESIESLRWGIDNRHLLDASKTPFDNMPIMDKNACLSYLEQIINLHTKR